MDARSSSAATSSAATSRAAAPAARARVDAVDLLRGVAMILMALDHARNYFGDAAANLLNLATTTAPLFLTRWVTHFCAPVFFLLTGVGAYLSGRRRSDGGSPSALSRFLLARGLWLVLVELTVVRFLWQFNADYRVTMLTVLWALGWSMVALAALVWLRPALAATLGVALIVGHDLTDAFGPDALGPDAFGALAPLWTVLHRPGPLVTTPRAIVFVAYPLVPWIGVVAAGYGLGPVFTWTRERRRALLARLGTALVVAFVVGRALNIYGDPSRWSGQPSALFTWLSFLNTSKYPPSLLFLLMTLGPALLFLRLVDRPMTTPLLRPAVVIGRVPFFYYALHVAVLHGLAVLVCAVRFGGVHWMFESPTVGQFPVTQPPDWPVPLAVVYAAWGVAVVLMYPCCRWYAALRARRTDDWLSYL